MRTQKEYEIIIKNMIAGYSTEAAAKAISEYFISKFNEMLTAVEEYAPINGSREVHRSWRDTMLSQDREVSEKRKNYETLYMYDKVLDSEIASDVIKDFLVWYEGHKLK